MKHVDGATMTHMLRLTGADLDVGGEEKKKKHSVLWARPQNGEVHDTVGTILNFLVNLPEDVSTYWFDLQENALSLLISSLDRLNREQ